MYIKPEMGEGKEDVYLLSPGAHIIGPDHHQSTTQPSSQTNSLTALKITFSKLTLEALGLRKQHALASADAQELEDMFLCADGSTDSMEVQIRYSQAILRAKEIKVELERVEEQIAVLKVRIWGAGVRR